MSEEPKPRSESAALIVTATFAHIQTAIGKNVDAKFEFKIQGDGMCASLAERAMRLLQQEIEGSLYEKKEKA
jgi:hypothetical protein